jgi:hypothetical protein
MHKDGCSTDRRPPTFIAVVVVVVVRNDETAVRTVSRRRFHVQIAGADTRI